MSYLSALEISKKFIVYKMLCEFTSFTKLLLCFRRWRSIVMSMSVCLSVCVSVCPRACLRSHTRDLYQFLCVLPMAVARSSSGMVTNIQGEGSILQVSSTLTIHCNAFAAKGIIQSPITSCSRRDHSVCQSSANWNPENSERQRCGLSAENGVMSVDSAGEL